MENQYLRKENETFKSRMDALEQNQLTNNVMLTFKPYSVTKLRVHEMIASIIASGNTEDDLTKAQNIDITSCNWVGKYRPNNSRPISITFSKRDDKELFLSSKR